MQNIWEYCTLFCVRNRIYVLLKNVLFQCTKKSVVLTRQTLFNTLSVICYISTCFVDNVLTIICMSKVLVAWTRMLQGGNGRAKDHPEIIPTWKEFDTSVILWKHDGHRHMGFFQINKIYVHCKDKKRTLNACETSIGSTWNLHGVQWYKLFPREDSMEIFHYWNKNV